MLTHTQAYGRHKNSNQNELDVVLLLCHAIPALKAYMKAVDAGNPKKIPDPDHFQVPQPHSRLKAIIPRYRKVIGRMLFIASFSYFEAYFKDVVAELFSFHGSATAWAENAKRRSAAAVVPAEASDFLAEPMKKAKQEKYRKHIHALEQDPKFQFPSERLAAFGVLKLEENLGDLRAVDIEMMATRALGVPVVADEWVEFQKLRDRRNNIAHGRADEVDLVEAIAASKHLGSLAKAIDTHVVQHLMLLECV